MNQCIQASFHIWLRTLEINVFYLNSLQLFSGASRCTYVYIGHTQLSFSCQQGWKCPNFNNCTFCARNGHLGALIYWAFGNIIKLFLSNQMENYGTNLDEKYNKKPNFLSVWQVIKLILSWCRILLLKIWHLFLKEMSTFHMAI